MREVKKAFPVGRYYWLPERVQKPSLQGFYLSQMWYHKINWSLGRRKGKMVKWAVVTCGSDIVRWWWGWLVEEMIEIMRCLWNVPYWNLLPWWQDTGRWLAFCDIGVLSLGDYWCSCQRVCKLQVRGVELATQITRGLPLWIFSPWMISHFLRTVNLLLKISARWIWCCCGSWNGRLMHVLQRSVKWAWNWFWRWLLGNYERIQIQRDAISHLFFSQVSSCILLLIFNFETGKTGRQSELGT